MSNCAEIAANLSSNYLSTATYDGISPLADYLMATGVLLSVCLFENCTANAPLGPSNFQPKDNAHLSGSWIQESTTGPNIFGNVGIHSHHGDFFPEGAIGMIFDPRHVEFECIYPLDALSDQREAAGCGPLITEHLTWSQKMEIFAMIFWRKVTQFTITPWDQIPCSKLFAGKANNKKSPGLKGSFGMMDRQQRWENLLTFAKQTVEGIFGHTVCWDDSTPDFADGYYMLPYIGADPWRPEEWAASADIMHDILQQHPDKGIWNEVVMKNLGTDEEYAKALQAIFYVSAPNDGGHFEKLAYTEAARLGGKPVIEFNQHVLEDKVLFQCPPDQGDYRSEYVSSKQHGTKKMDIIEIILGGHILPSRARNDATFPGSQEDMAAKKRTRRS